MKMPGSIGVNLRVTGHCSQGGRKYMEDFFSVAYQQSEDGKDLEYAFFGIYDGHGGSEAAIFAKEHLMNIIVRQKLFWSDNDADIRKAIYEGYLATHYAMWREQEKWPKTNSGLPSTAGTTASIAFIRHGKIYIGHVGDSGIVLGYQEEGEQFWRAKQLTQDHKPESTVEKTRIMNSGGKVVIKSGVPRVVWNRPRIGHQGPVRRSTLIDEIPFLAIARSLGDLWSYNCDSDEFVVSPVPDVRVIKIDSKKFRCLIFGTDGLWNVLLPGGAVEIVRSAEHANDQALFMQPVNEDDYQSIPNNRQKSTKDWINPSKCLVDRALEIWSRTKMRADNTSVVTIMLDPPGPPKRDLLKSYTNHSKSAEQQQHNEMHNQNIILNENNSTNQYYSSPYTNQNDRNFTMYDHTTKETIDIDNIPLPTSGLAIMTRYETNSNDHLESTESSSSILTSSTSGSSSSSTSTTTGDVMHSFTESYNSLYNSIPYDDHSYNLLYNPSITTPTTMNDMNNMNDNNVDDVENVTTAIVTDADINPINYNDHNESITPNHIENDENGINIEDENIEYPIVEDTYSLTSLETRQQSQMNTIETPSYTDLSTSMVTTASSAAAAAAAAAAASASVSASPSANSSPTISFHGFNQEYTEDCVYYDHYYNMNVYERAIKTNNIQQLYNDSIPIPVNQYLNHSSSSSSSSSSSAPTTTISHTTTTTTTTTSSSSALSNSIIPRFVSNPIAASSSDTSTNAIIQESIESNPIEYEAITNSTNNNNNNNSNDNNNISNNENLLNDSVQIYEISSSSVPISSSSPSILSSSSSSSTSLKSNSNRKSPSILNLNIENDHKYSKSFKKCIKNNKTNIKNRSRILTRSNQFERRHILRQQNNLVASPVVGRILNYTESVKSYNTKVRTCKSTSTSSSSSSITPIKLDKKTVINVQPYKVLNGKYNQTIHLANTSQQTNPTTSSSSSNSTNSNNNTTTTKSTSILDINIIKRNQSLTINKSTSITMPTISSSPSKLSIIHVDNQRVLRSKDQRINATSSSSSSSSSTSSIITRATKIQTKILTNPMKHYHRLNKTSLTIKSNTSKKLLSEDLCEKSSIFEKRILQENLGRSNKRNNSKIINVIGSSIPPSSSSSATSTSSSSSSSSTSIISSSSLAYKITRSSSRVKLRNRK